MEETIRNAIACDDDENLLDILKDKQKDFLFMSGKPVIHIAAKQNAYKCLLLLVEKLGYSLPTADEDGRTELHVACEYGSINFLNLILKSKREKSDNETFKNYIDQKDKKGWSPLYEAVDEDQYETSKILLENGASTEVHTNEKGRTPLHNVATFASNHDFIGLLIQFKADVHSRNNWKQTPLHLAVRHHKFKNVIRLLECGADILAQDKHGDSVLHDAVYKNNYEMIKLLLEKGANVDSKDNKESTPLHEAVKRETKSEIIDLFIKYNVNLNACTRHSQRPLHFAVRKGFHINAKKLIDSGADIDAVDETKDSPLHDAIKTNNYECAVMLLKEGAKTELRNSPDGNTPLLEAAKRDHKDKDYITLLAKYKAVFNVKNNEGLTPREVAVNENIKINIDRIDEINSILALEREKGESALHAVISIDNYRAAKLLLQRGSNANVFSSEYQSTPVHIAASIKTHNNYFDLLNEFKTDMNARLNGNTPLHAAIEQNICENVERLLTVGADVTALNSQNQTPLDVAINKGNKDVINVILNHSVTQEIDKYHINFSCLIPNIKGRPETTSLQNMNLKFAEREFNEVLNHPVLKIFVSVKTRYMRFFKLFVDFRLLMFFLTAFIYLYKFNAFLHNEKVAENKAYRNNSTKTAHSGDNSALKYSLEINVDELYFWWYLWAIQVLFHAFNEYLEIKPSPLNYLLDMMNFIDIYVMLACPLCCPYINSFDFQTTVAGLAMIACGLNFMFVFGSTLPFLSIEIMMFRGVFGRILLLLLPYSIVILSFLLVFYSMFSSFDESFISFGSSFIMIPIMMVSGIDDAIVKLGDPNVNDITNVILICFFIILIMIVMVNLVTGLAVNVSSDYMDHNIFKVYQRDIEMIHYLEVLLSNFPFNLNRFTSLNCSEKFNKITLCHKDTSLKQYLHKGTFGFLIYRESKEGVELDDINLRLENVFANLSDCVNKKVGDLQKLIKNTSDLADDLKKDRLTINEKFDSTNKKIDDLSEKLEEMEKLLKELCTKMKTYTNSDHKTN